MKSNLLPNGADALLAVAEDVAAVLSEKRSKYGMGIDVEASLRAGISAATFGVNAYLELLAASDQSEGSFCRYRNGSPPGHAVPATIFTLRPAAGRF